MQHRTIHAAARYVGPQLRGAQNSGETLAPNSVVEIVFIDQRWGFARVDMASDEFGTGRTYTVWNVPLSQLEFSASLG